MRQQIAYGFWFWGIAGLSLILSWLAARELVRPTESLVDSAPPQLVVPPGSLAERCEGMGVIATYGITNGLKERIIRLENLIRTREEDTATQLLCQLRDSSSANDDLEFKTQIRLLEADWYITFRDVRNARSLALSIMEDIPEDRVEAEDDIGRLWATATTTLLRTHQGTIEDDGSTYATCVERATGIFESHGDWRSMGALWENFAEVFIGEKHTKCNNRIEKLCHARESYLLGGLGLDAARVHSRIQNVMVECDNGDIPSCAETLEEGLTTEDFKEQLDTVSRMKLSINEVVAQHIEAGDDKSALEKVLEQYRQIIRGPVTDGSGVSLEVGALDARDLGSLYGNLGEVLLSLNQPKQAREAFGRSWSYYNSCGDSCNINKKYLCDDVPGMKAILVDECEAFSEERRYDSTLRSDNERIHQICSSRS